MTEEYWASWKKVKDIQNSNKVLNDVSSKRFAILTSHVSRSTKEYEQWQSETSTQMNFMPYAAPTTITGDTIEPPTKSE